MGEGRQQRLNEAAITTLPQNTRALGRSYIVNQLLNKSGTRYVIDWDAVYIECNRQRDLKNPFYIIIFHSLRCGWTML